MGGLLYTFLIYSIYTISIYRDKLYYIEGIHIRSKREGGEKEERRKNKGRTPSL